MLNLHEVFRLLNEISKEEDKREIIQIDVNVSKADPIVEDIPSGKILDKYDDQTLEEWYDFASTIEGIADSLGEVVNISLSKNLESLSEYIDFYVIDKDGNKKNYLIDLRLSDHGATENSRRLRKKKVARIDTNYELASIVINKNSRFKSYSDAISYFRSYLANKIIN